MINFCRPFLYLLYVLAVLCFWLFKKLIWHHQKNCIFSCFWSQGINHQLLYFRQHINSFTLPVRLLSRNQNVFKNHDESFPLQEDNFHLILLLVHRQKFLVLTNNIFFYCSGTTLMRGRNYKLEEILTTRRGVLVFHRFFQPNVNALSFFVRCFHTFFHNFLNGKNK